MSYFSSPGIFNCLDDWDPSLPGIPMVANSMGDAENNARVLQAAITAAQAAASGCNTSPKFAATVLIPGHSVVPPPVNPSGTTDNGAEYFIAIPHELENTQTAAILIDCWWPLLILGTGNVKLTMVVNQDGFWGDMFQAATSHSSGNLNIGGVTFQDLHLGFQTVTGVSPLPAAIHAGPNAQPGAQNVRIVRVVFDDCPIGAWFDNVNQGSMLQCSSIQQMNSPSLVVVGNRSSGNVGKEIYIAGCVFLSMGTGGTGITLEGTDHLRVSDTRLEGFYQAILINPGNNPGQNVTRSVFTDVSAYTGANAQGNVGTALTIRPTVNVLLGNSGSIGDLTFMGCEFEPSEGLSSSGPGVLIDEGANPIGKPTIEAVRFIGCAVRRWSGNGLQVNSGRNIEVIGGMYAGNSATSGLGAGIYIGAPTSPASPAANIRVQGAACVGVYQDIQVGSNTQPAQQQVGIYIDSAASDIVIDGCDISDNNKYGIYIDAGPSDINVTGCNLQSNGTYGVYITGESASETKNVFIRTCDVSGYSSYSTAINISGTLGTNIANIQVTDCAGYNDQSYAVTTTVPSSGFNGATQGYFGPVVVFGAGSSGVFAVKVGLTSGTAVAVPVTNGTFPLAPGDLLFYSGGTKWTSFLMLGQ